MNRGVLTLVKLNSLALLGSWDYQSLQLPPKTPVFSPVIRTTALWWLMALGWSSVSFILTTPL